MTIWDDISGYISLIIVFKSCLNYLILLTIKMLYFNREGVIIIWVLYLKYEQIHLVWKGDDNDLGTTWRILERENTICVIEEILR